VIRFLAGHFPLVARTVLASLPRFAASLLLKKRERERGGEGGEQARKEGKGIKVFFG
jgi:hypothetical protein